MRVEFQRKQMEFPTAQFGYLRDSTDALADIDELRRRIAADGYLFIRGLIDRDAVHAARRVVMEHLREQDALVTAPLTIGTPIPDHQETKHRIPDRTGRGAPRSPTNSRLSTRHSHFHSIQ